jgi:AcrR family transcriptional regulator
LKLAIEMTSPTRSTDTRRRLLEAGVEVFSEEGFRKATIQAICKRARANIAAAHYHFGDKEGLYAAVFAYAEQRASEDKRPAMPEGATPSARLKAHVASFLSRLLDSGRPAWMARLISREMIEPTHALDRLVRRRMRANHEQLAAIIRELLGPGGTKDTVRFCTLSVIAQCVFYRNSAPVIARLYPDIVPSHDVSRIADHVSRFSLAAIRGLRGKRGRS